jgi:hypothetical protein
LAQLMPLKAGASMPLLLATNVRRGRLRKWIE